MCGGEGPTENREILRENEDRAAVHQTMTRDHAVTGDRLFLHPEIAAVMFDEHVVFFERSFVDQGLDPFPGRKFAFGVLGIDPFFAAADTGACTFFFELPDDVLHESAPLNAPNRDRSQSVLGD